MMIVQVLLSFFVAFLVIWGSNFRHKVEGSRRDVVLFLPTWLLVFLVAALT